ncbi:MAG TPA: GDSL-type esterase/lipase family protein [Pseudoduganella sp.]
MKNIMHVACAGLMAAACGVPAAWAGGCATSAAPRAVDYPWMSIERWQQMNAGQVARAEKGDVDVLFAGDSLTEMWPMPLWDSNFGHLKPANFGIGGDHTGNLLWRLKQPAIAALKPKLVVLMIGVNNINLCNEGPDEVFKGIQTVVEMLRKHYPAARILLNAVLPEGLPESDERRRIVALNQRVRTLGDGQTVFFRDYGSHFTGEGGTLSHELQPDLLHFSEQGYRILAAAMRPDIESLLK